MEEQALSVVFKTLRKGKCIAILGSKSKEAKTNLFLLNNFSLSSFFENSKD
jgi:hypothetical protein